MAYTNQPRRRSSSAVWALATIVVLLAIALIGAALWLLTRNTDDSASAPPSPVTVTETSTPLTTQVTVTEQPQPQPQPTIVVPQASTPVEGGTCYESEARRFATAANGMSVVCVYMGAGGGFKWARHAENDGSVHNLGEPCDPAVDRVAQDPSGKAIMCGGQYWVDGP